MTLKRLLILAGVMVVCLASPGKAQDPFAGGDPFNPADLIDYPEEMRNFIMDIASYARRYDRDFLVLVKDAESLFTRIVDEDTLTSGPTTTFLRNLDGVIQSNVFYGFEEYGKATPEEDQEEMFLDIAATEPANLPVFTLDYVSKPADVDSAFRQARRKGWVSYAPPGRGFANNRLPAWPKRPHDENSHHIQRLSQVQNFLYLNDSSRFGSRDEFALELQSTNYDMLVVDVFHHRLQPLSKQNIDTLKHKKLGSRRLVLARMDIGTAITSRYYWQDNWGTGNPFYIMEPMAGVTDEYVVQFWDATWQDIFTGNEQSYIYGIIDQGFDGVVIDGANAHLLFSEPED